MVTPKLIFSRYYHYDLLIMSTETPKSTCDVLGLMYKCVLNSGSTVLNSNASVNIHITNAFIK